MKARPDDEATKTARDAACLGRCVEPIEPQKSSGNLKCPHAGRRESNDGYLKDSEISPEQAAHVAGLTGSLHMVKYGLSAHIASYRWSLTTRGFRVPVQVHPMQPPAHGQNLTAWLNDIIAFPWPGRAGQEAIAARDRALVVPCGAWSVTDSKGHSKNPSLHEAALHVLLTFANLWRSTRLTLNCTPFGLGVVTRRALQAYTPIPELDAIFDDRSRRVSLQVMTQHPDTHRMGCLFGATSMVNAACRKHANIRMSWQRDNKRVRSYVGSEDIDCGSELFYCYGQHTETGEPLRCPFCNECIDVADDLTDDDDE